MRGPLYEEKILTQEQKEEVKLGMKDGWHRQRVSGAEQKWAQSPCVNVMRKLKKNLTLKKPRLRRDNCTSKGNWRPRFQRKT